MEIRFVNVIYSTTVGQIDPKDTKFQLNLRT
jgi:hypothetical protein